MKKELTPDKMTNSELKTKMKSLENEYEGLKQQTVKMICRMEELDVEYDKLKKELYKRNGGLNG